MLSVLTDAEVTALCLGECVVTVTSLDFMEG